MKCIECKHTQFAQRRLIRTDTKERFATALEVEHPAYRHFPNTVQRYFQSRTLSPTQVKARQSTEVLWHAHALEQTL